MSLYLDVSAALVELRTGILTRQWQQWITNLFGQVDSLTTSVNALPGVNRKTYTELNALGLGASDAGYLAFEPDYGHLLRWTGSVWEFAPGDCGNKFFRDFVGVPQEVGWQLCDGTATDYLTVGSVTLSVTALTPPAMSGYYRKGAASYTGSTVAAVAPGVSGSTASAGTHTHGFSGTTDLGDQNAIVTLGNYDNTTPSGHRHDFSGTTDSDGAHTHTLSLTADTAADPAHLGVLVYFRR